MVTTILDVRARQIAALFRESLSEWNQDNVPRLGAALAFYTLLSLAPMLIVIVAIAALVYGKQAVTGELAWQIQGLVGRDAARSIQAIIQGAYKPGVGLLASSLSVLTLIFGASSVVVELRDDLNLIWHSPTPPARTRLARVIRLAKDRFYSFALVIGAGLVLLILLVLSVWASAVGKLFGADAAIPEPLLHLATFGVSFLVVTFLFGAIYKILPDAALAWRDVIVGASVTSLVFSIGKQVIGLYLGKASFNSYGAAGSVVVLLVWVYYSAQLFFLGAEFTKVYAKTFGSRS